ncbi:hypothetical protein J5J86_13580 [Aquabacter sp. L1I39]|uniref:hypothetical protein n=1 Tax=Aquabacter sp. L1I39 TaxID=2820278 RepID=UPI001ADB96E4|nr:hypothetical protein [Aquabacter sp. L1I39]QTL01838.1 hypothetical protein J5J86_13580 [Aquabacter sp. L1I39]
MFNRPLEPDTQEPLTPEQERVLRKVRRFSMVSGLIMVLGLASVFGVIAYRMLRDKVASPGEITTTLPKGAEVVSTAVSGDTLVLTLKVGGTVEIRTFRLDTLAPTGRLKFAVEP